MAAGGLTPGRNVVMTAERKKAGGEIVKLTDHAGFQASGAAWVWNADSNHWHFLLISHMIDSKGPLWVYQRLMRIFSKFHLPPLITPLDILIKSPRQVDYRDFLIRVNNDGDEISEITDLSVNDLGIDYMAIYRMLPLPKNAGEQTRKFDSRVNELMAA